ncbi:hypothetical protein BSKO_10660 [Bryopsis sp. KO-2023]|nr:hypothetical protein BSKO_10660 [Bryopsis sp. KO-2023]
MARNFIDTAIAENPVMVFSKSWCPSCAKAKRALRALLDPSKFTVLEIEDRPDCGELQNELASITGARTVPRVFIGGQCIGGGDETAQMLASGELKKALVSVGAL